MATYCAIPAEDIEAMLAAQSGAYPSEHSSPFCQPHPHESPYSAASFRPSQFVSAFPRTRSSLGNGFYSPPAPSCAPPQHARLKPFDPILLPAHQSQPLERSYHPDPPQHESEFVQRLLAFENPPEAGRSQSFSLDVPSLNLLEPTTTAHYNPSSSPPASPEMNYAHAEPPHSLFAERAYEANSNNLIAEFKQAGIASDFGSSDDATSTIVVPTSDILKQLGLEKRDSFEPYKGDQSHMCIGLSEDSISSEVDDGTLFAMFSEPLYAHPMHAMGDDPYDQSMYAEESSFPSSPPLSSPVLYNFPYAHVKPEAEDDAEDARYAGAPPATAKRVYKTRSGRGSVKRPREEDYYDDGDADYCDDDDDEDDDEDDDDDYLDAAKARRGPQGHGRKPKCAKTERTTTTMKKKRSSPRAAKATAIAPPIIPAESEEEAIASLYPLSTGAVAVKDVLKSARASDAAGAGADKRHKGKQKHAVPPLSFPAKFPPEWKLLVAMEAENNVDYELDRFLRIQRIDLRSMEHEPHGDELSAKITDLVARYRREIDMLNRACDTFKRPFQRRAAGAGAFSSAGVQSRAAANAGGMHQAVANDGGYDPDDSPRRKTRRSAAAGGGGQRQPKPHSAAIDDEKAREMVRTIDLKFEYLRVELRQNVCEAVVLLYKQHMDTYAKVDRLSGTKKRRKRRGSFNESVKKTLIEWFNANANHPYPSKEEVMILAAKADLTINQVSGWFSNWRAREKRRAEEEGGVAAQ